MTKLIIVERCESCPYKRFSAILMRDVCGHLLGDCWDINSPNDINEHCPLHDSPIPANFSGINTAGYEGN